MGDGWSLNKLKISIKKENDAEKPLNGIIFYSLLALKLQGWIYSLKNFCTLRNPSYTGP